MSKKSSSTSQGVISVTAEGVKETIPTKDYIKSINPQIPSEEIDQMFGIDKSLLQSVNPVTAKSEKALTKIEIKPFEFKNPDALASDKQKWLLFTRFKSVMGLRKKLGLETFKLPTALNSEGQQSEWHGLKASLPLTLSVKQISDKIATLTKEYNDCVEKLQSVGV